MARRLSVNMLPMAARAVDQQQLQIPLRSTLPGGRHNPACQSWGADMRASEAGNRWSSSVFEEQLASSSGHVRLGPFHDGSRSSAICPNFIQKLETMRVSQSHGLEGVQSRINANNVSPRNFRMHLISPSVEGIHISLIDVHVQGMRGCPSSNSSEHTKIFTNIQRRDDQGRPF